MRDFDTYGGRSQKIDAAYRLLEEVWQEQLEQKLSYPKLLDYLETKEGDIPFQPPTISHYISALTTTPLSRIRRAHPNQVTDRARAILQTLEFILLEKGKTREEIEKRYEGLPNDETYVRNWNTTVGKGVPGTAYSRLSYSNTFSEEAFLAFEEADHEIWIVDTFLDDRYFRSAVGNALAKNKGLTINILLAHPHSAIARLRLETLKGQGINADLEGDLWFLSKIANKYPDQVHLRCYNQLPGLHYMGTEKICYSGWFWMGKSSLNAPWIQFKPESVMGKATAKHVREMWKSSLPVDLTLIRNRDDAIRYLRMPPVISFHSISAISDENKPKEAYHFRCIYYRKEQFHFYALTYFPTDRRVLISCTRTEEVYFGTCAKVGKTVLIIAQSNVSNRTVYITAETGSMQSQDLGSKEITLGMTAYINPEGESHTSRIILQRIEELPTTHEEIHLPLEKLSLGMYGYIKGSESTIVYGNRVHTLDDLDQLFGPEPMASGKARQNAKRWAGIYDYYAVHADNQGLVKNTFLLMPTGEILLNWYDNIEYHGRITHYFGYSLFFEVISEDQTDGFCGVLQIGRNRSMKGLFSGMAVQQINGGRIYIKPSEVKTLEEAEVKRIPWESPDYRELTREYADIHPFFLGEDQGNFFLDDPTEYLAEPHRVKFPPSGNINAVVGTFEYYYTSAHDSPCIRKMVMRIHADHGVEVKGRDNYRMEGHVLMYDHYLVIRLFEPGESGKLRGFHFLYSLPGNTHTMTGISTITANGRPIGRRIICIRTEEEFDDLEATQINIGWDQEAYHHLNQEHPNLATLLTGDIGNYVQTPAEDNMHAFSPRYRPFWQPDHAENSFFAACHLATKEKPFIVIERRLNQAFLQGYADQETFDYSLSAEGSLYPYRDLVINLLVNTRGTLLHPPGVTH